MLGFKVQAKPVSKVSVFTYSINFYNIVCVIFTLEGNDHIIGADGTLINISIGIIFISYRTHVLSSFPVKNNI